MGYSVNTSVNTVKQTSVNNVFQSSRSLCVANCVNTIEGVNIIIGPGATVDAITFKQECAAEALCAMKNNLDAVASNQLAAIQNAEASSVPRSVLTGDWPGFSINSTFNKTVQSLSNTTTQIIDSVCEANSENYLSNVNVFVGEGAGIGNVEFIQVGEATADCAIDNLASATVSNLAVSDQTALSTSGSIWLLIVVVLGICGTVIAVVYFNTKAEEEQIYLTDAEAVAQNQKRRVDLEETKAAEQAQTDKQKEQRQAALGAASTLTKAPVKF